MAETLGEAVLYLRTDDSGLNPGMNKAQAGAVALGGSFDKTSTSSTRLTRELTTTGTAAARSGVQFTQAGGAVTASVGAQAMGMRQLTMQLNDVATMYAMGARPMQIYTSQIGQLLQAVQLMSGGTNKLANFLGGPWGMAITMATLVLSPFIGKLFETESAMEAVEDGADGMARAQSALAPVFDLVSGKLKTQNELLIINARLMAANLRAEAISKRASARETLVGAQQAGLNDSVLSATEASLARMFRTGPTGPSEGQANAAAAAQLLREIASGKTTRAEAIQRSETMDFAGTRVTRGEFQGALRDAVVANLNERAAALIDQSLDSGELAADLRNPGKSPRTRQDTGPTAAETERRFTSQLTSITQQILGSRQQIATSAEERAELEARAVEWARREAIADVQADEHFTAAQKAELEAALTRRADAELETIEFRKRRELEGQAQGLADDRYRSEQEALQVQLQLADTEADRKAIALQIFDAEEAYLKSKLEAVVASETATEAEKERARRAIEALEGGSAGRRAGVERANETEVEQYLRHLNKTPGQINEAIGGIAIDGLEALNDGIVDAILNFEDLGDTVSKVAKQIAADLLRLGVQRMVTAPLANALFGSGGEGGAIPGLFSGFFASGGLIPAGTFGIVGENGPEPVIGTSAGAKVLPNSALGGMGRPGSLHVTVSGARGNSEIEQMVAAGVSTGLRTYNSQIGEHVTDYALRRQ